jgi:hypothetical protein
MRSGDCCQNMVPSEGTLWRIHRSTSTYHTGIVHLLYYYRRQYIFLIVLCRSQDLVCTCLVPIWICLLNCILHRAAAKRGWTCNSYLYTASPGRVCMRYNPSSATDVSRESPIQACMVFLDDGRRLEDDALPTNGDPAQESLSSRSGFAGRLCLNSCNERYSSDSQTAQDQSRRREAVCRTASLITRKSRRYPVLDTIRNWHYTAQRSWTIEGSSNLLRLPKENRGMSGTRYDHSNNTPSHVQCCFPPSPPLDEPSARERKHGPRHYDTTREGHR